MGCMAVAAILFSNKDSFINAQDELAPILPAIAIYFTFKSLIAICSQVGLHGQWIRNPYTSLSAAYHCWRLYGKCNDIPAQRRIKNPGSDAGGFVYSSPVATLVDVSPYAALGHV